MFDVSVCKCPADLLNVVLSIYMHADGANIQLPETDEVLVCNSSTTTEDVSLSTYFIMYKMVKCS